MDKNIKVTIYDSYNTAISKSFIETGSFVWMIYLHDLIALLETLAEIMELLSGKCPWRDILGACDTEVTTLRPTVGLHNQSIVFLKSDHWKEKYIIHAKEPSLEPFLEPISRIYP